MDLMMSALVTVLNAWCTNAYFRYEVAQRWFCRRPDGGRHAHYVEFHVFRRWARDRLFDGTVASFFAPAGATHTGGNELSTQPCALATRFEEGATRRRLHDGHSLQRNMAAPQSGTRAAVWRVWRMRVSAFVCSWSLCGERGILIAENCKQVCMCMFRYPRSKRCPAFHTWSPYPVSPSPNQSRASRWMRDRCTCHESGSAETHC